MTGKMTRGGPCFGDDHDRCRARMQAAIDDKSLHLTPIRRRVLEILLEDHKALGAYDVLRRLGEEGVAPQPPVAYRALNWLQEAGLVHRVERLNAYVACGRPEHGHHAALMVCRSCRLVAETAVSAPLPAEALAAAGFKVEETVIEAVGLCADCAKDAATSARP